MAKTLYLMRHGQTLFNLRHKVQGWCDAPLTDFGVYQAKVAGQYFKDAGITFDDAYSSTQERACDTLELVTDDDGNSELRVLLPGDEYLSLNIPTSRLLYQLDRDAYIEALNAARGVPAPLAEPNEEQEGA